MPKGWRHANVRSAPQGSLRDAVTAAARTVAGLVSCCTAASVVVPGPEPPLDAIQFAQDAIGAIDHRQRLPHEPDIDRDRAIGRAVIAQLAAERLPVAIEHQADNLAGLIDHRRPRIASDNVVRGDEIEWLLWVQRWLRFEPALRQPVGGRSGCPFEQPLDHRDWRDGLAVLRIACNRAI